MSQDGYNHFVVDDEGWQATPKLRWVKSGPSKTTYQLEQEWRRGEEVQWREIPHVIEEST